MSEIKSPIKAIRAKCIECSCGQVNEVRECPVTGARYFHFVSVKIRIENR